MVCSLNFNRDGHKLSVEAGSGIPLLNVATGGGKLRDGRQSDARHAATRRRRRKGFAKIFTGLHLFEGLRRKHEADEVEELEGKANGDDVPQLLLEGVCSIKEVKCLRERLHYLQRGGGVTPRNDAEIAVASQQTQSWWDKQGLRTCVPVRP